MLAEQLKMFADGPEVERLMEETILRMSLKPAEEAILRDEARARLQGLQSLAVALAHPEDEIELYRTVAAFWLELRFAWRRNEFVMNHRGARSDAPHALALALGSVGAFVLNGLEGALDAAHVEFLTRCVSDLLDRARPALSGPGFADPLVDPARSGDTNRLSSCLIDLTDAMQLLADWQALVCELGLGPADAERLKGYLQRKRKDVLDLCTTHSGADDEPALQRAVAALWLELRFEWQRYNMVLNYQTVLGNPTDPVMFACAGHCSGLLGRIEKMINEEDRERMASFAAELITGADGDLRQESCDGRISLSIY